MSDAELIARLRESQSYEWQDPIWETRLAAADRIEALTKERDEAVHLSRMRKTFIEEARDERDALEAKLTKAVGLLGKSLVKEKRDLSSTLYEEISDFIEEIAEIKGESHD